MESTSTKTVCWLRSWSMKKLQRCQPMNCKRFWTSPSRSRQSSNTTALSFGRGLYAIFFLRYKAPPLRRGHMSFFFYQLKLLAWRRVRSVP
ncbi:hypothetical protein AVT69_gp006 [Pseudomonas phage PhiPA3]|uniref:Uncharacterized protein 006 n=1 Tax=Pseudomonas phage PhiPA3 TaxID=998086 RepID=F8SJN7_BPPA3|nr:hypothetical protein AVT69_gp006 [Pseudomonas phage PhiPA3]AEH03432.1 hypothetical protein [Pseudomonas phage PhiPA3]